MILTEISIEILAELLGYRVRRRHTSFTSYYCPVNTSDSNIISFHCDYLSNTPLSGGSCWRNPEQAKKCWLEVLTKLLKNTNNYDDLDKLMDYKKIIAEKLE